MTTYALLQRTLDQTISREAMEEASVAAPMVARGDCARLQNELFGVVVRKLDEANARAFQGALRGHGFETEVVPETELFALPGPFRVDALRVEHDTIATTDTYGRDRVVPLRECVFAAAGYVTRDRDQRTWTTELVARGAGRFQRVTLEPVTHWERQGYAQFRIEIFFASDPVRVEWVVEEGRMARLNGQPLRLRNPDEIGAFVALLRARFPAERINRGIAHWGEAGEPRYPNLRSFEEETLWHFHRLRSPRTTEPTPR